MVSQFVKQGFDTGALEHTLAVRRDTMSHKAEGFILATEILTTGSHHDLKAGVLCHTMEVLYAAEEASQANVIDGKTCDWGQTIIASKARFDLLLVALDELGKDVLTCEGESISERASSAAEDIAHILVAVSYKKMLLSLCALLIDDVHLESPAFLSRLLGVLESRWRVWMGYIDNAVTSRSDGEQDSSSYGQQVLLDCRKDFGTACARLLLLVTSRVDPTRKSNVSVPLQNLASHIVSQLCLHVESGSDACTKMDAPFCFHQWESCKVIDATDVGTEVWTNCNPVTCRRLDLAIINFSTESPAAKELQVTHEGGSFTVDLDTMVMTSELAASTSPATLLVTAPTQQFALRVQDVAGPTSVLASSTGTPPKNADTSTADFRTGEVVLSQLNGKEAWVPVVIVAMHSGEDYDIVPFELSSADGPVSRVPRSSLRSGKGTNALKRSNFQTNADFESSMQYFNTFFDLATTIAKTDVSIFRTGKWLSLLLQCLSNSIGVSKYASDVIFILKRLLPTLDPETLNIQLPPKSTSLKEFSRKNGSTSTSSWAIDAKDIVYFFVRACHTSVLPTESQRSRGVHIGSDAVSMVRSFLCSDKWAKVVNEVFHLCIDQFEHFFTSDCSDAGCENTAELYQDAVQHYLGYLSVIGGHIEQLRPGIAVACSSVSDASIRKSHFELMLRTYNPLKSRATISITMKGLPIPGDDGDEKSFAATALLAQEMVIDVKADDLSLLPGSEMRPYVISETFKSHIVGNLHSIFNHFGRGARVEVKKNETGGADSLAIGSGTGMAGESDFELEKLAIAVGRACSQNLYRMVFVEPCNVRAVPDLDHECCEKCQANALLSIADIVTTSSGHKFLQLTHGFESAPEAYISLRSTTGVPVMRKEALLLLEEYSRRHAVQSSSQKQVATKIVLNSRQIGCVWSEVQDTVEATKGKILEHVAKLGGLGEPLLTAKTIHLYSGVVELVSHSAESETTLQSFHLGNQNIVAVCCALETMNPLSTLLLQQTVEFRELKILCELCRSKEFRAKVLNESLQAPKVNCSDDDETTPLFEKMLLFANRPLANVGFEECPELEELAEALYERFQVLNVQDPEGHDDDARKASPGTGSGAAQVATASSGSVSEAASSGGSNANSNAAGSGAAQVATANRWGATAEASNTPPSANTEAEIFVDPDAMMMLLSMGFREDLCVEALLTHRGDANEAVNWLLMYGDEALLQQEAFGGGGGGDSSLGGGDSVDMQRPASPHLQESAKVLQKNSYICKHHDGELKRWWSAETDAAASPSNAGDSAVEDGIKQEMVVRFRALSEGGEAIMVALSPDTDGAAGVYQVVFGACQNAVPALLTKGPVKEGRKVEHDGETLVKNAVALSRRGMSMPERGFVETVVDECSHTSFWIVAGENGHLSCGLGDTAGEEILFEFMDSDPIGALKHVSFTGIKSPIHIEDIEISERPISVEGVRAATVHGGTAVSLETILKTYFDVPESSSPNRPGLILNENNMEDEDGNHLYHREDRLFGTQQLALLENLNHTAGRSSHSKRSNKPASSNRRKNARRSAWCNISSRLQLYDGIATLSKEQVAKKLQETLDVLVVLYARQLVVQLFMEIASSPSPMIEFVDCLQRPYMAGLVESTLGLLLSVNWSAPPTWGLKLGVVDLKSPQLSLRNLLAKFMTVCIFSGGPAVVAVTAAPTTPTPSQNTVLTPPPPSEIKSASSTPSAVQSKNALSTRNAFYQALMDRMESDLLTISSPIKAQRGSSSNVPSDDSSGVGAHHLNEATVPYIVWLTELLLDCTTGAKAPHRIQWDADLFRLWSIVLSSSSMQLKELSFRILGRILHRALTAALHGPAYAPPLQTLLQFVDTDSIMKVAKTRLRKELEDAPLYSRYIQQLIGFASLLSQSISFVKTKTKGYRDTSPMMPRQLSIGEMPPHLSKAKARLGTLHDCVARFHGASSYVLLGRPDIAPPWTAEFMIRRCSRMGGGGEILSSRRSALLLRAGPKAKAAANVGFMVKGPDGTQHISFDYEAPKDEWVHLAFVAVGGTSPSITLWADHKKVGEHKSVSVSLPMDSIGGRLHSFKGDMSQVGHTSPALLWLCASLSFPCLPVCVSLSLPYLHALIFALSMPITSFGAVCPGSFVERCPGSW
jgi:hypothetical protein